MGEPSHGLHHGVMGGPDAGPRVPVMGESDHGTRLDLFGHSDPRFVDSLFTSRAAFADSASRPLSVSPPCQTVNSHPKGTT